ncbi:maleylpyruvate isomerase N-terminal domain-containing protein [Protofrankia symbiont of Coriaria ruscifolia]|uniref:maleylpyruvate isomerase N-terminal domain-containing protein n=1 Tax=Protofrankia symbiont of Coriaria ruscifolia TaxID=1306542 RepID=UPI0013EF602F|nr:maleylpyruvate isomerase N-terminal domain-containing protein [Protofrankia symbiont of Coriaria ruscifolia]
MTLTVANDMHAMADGTARLLAEVERLNNAGVRELSALPGWTRAHLITHLARNADGLVNLLTWARTGIVTPCTRSPGSAKRTSRPGPVGTPVIGSVALGGGKAWWTCAGRVLRRPARAR